jgi:hypothetical protein
MEEEMVDRQEKETLKLKKDWSRKKKPRVSFLE